MSGVRRHQSQEAALASRHGGCRIREIGRLRDAVLTHVRWRPMRLRGVTTTLRLSSPKLLLLAALFTLAPLSAGSGPSSGIRGFTSPHVAGERERELRLQAFPSADNLRDYMRTISAEPHHAGSVGSRKVAEYILGKFKSWGLNASIEQFEALMPYPTERVV